MGYDCVVLAKQVPDTNLVTGNAMNEDGTVNRAALPAIFNPEDLNALELALSIRERYGGSVTAVTMGLPKACDVLREALYRGADRVILLTDRRAAASDTLATSYILNCVVRKLAGAGPKGDLSGKDNLLILCGRQAIDGDTAQVGPQIAEKLGMTQITYVEELQELKNSDTVAFVITKTAIITALEEQRPRTLSSNWTLAGLNPETGKVMWKQRLTSSVLPGGILVDRHGRIIIVHEDGSISCFE